MFYSKEDKKNILLKQFEIFSELSTVQLSRLYLSALGIESRDYKKYFKDYSSVLNEVEDEGKIKRVYNKDGFILSLN